MHKSIYICRKATCCRFFLLNFAISLLCDVCSSLHHRILFFTSLGDIFYDSDCHDISNVVFMFAQI